MSKKNIEFRFKDIKDRNPVLTGRFHANIKTVV
jgi:hypothetical protein